MVCYWLSGDSREIDATMKRYADAYDAAIAEAVAGKEIAIADHHGEDTMRCLYLHSAELVSDAGSEYLSEITQCRDLLQEISAAWKLNSETVDEYLEELNDTIEELKAEQEQEQCTAWPCSRIVTSNQIGLRIR